MSRHTGVVMPVMVSIWTMVISLISSILHLGNHFNQNQLHPRELVTLLKRLNFTKDDFPRMENKIALLDQGKSG